MIIKSAQKKIGYFLVTPTEGNPIFVPDDMDNNDRIQLEEWLNEGNAFDEDIAEIPVVSPTYNWNGLAIRFEISQLNQVLIELKDESTNSLISPIWRISDDVVKIITLSIFSDEDRVGGMNRNIVNLLEKLKEGKVPISKEIKDELVDALVTNGFNETAEIVKGFEI